MNYLRPSVRQLLCASLMLPVLAIFPLAAAAQTDNSAQTRKLEQLKADIEKLKIKLDNARSERGALESLLQDNEQEIQRLQNQVEEQNEKLKQQQSQLDDLKSEQLALTKKKMSKVS